jgi:pimeloyl-ACP methyl ester carboxylesterase
VCRRKVIIRLRSEALTVNGRSTWAWLGIAVGLAGPAACAGQVPGTPSSSAAPSVPKVAFANIGGYRLAYECAGPRVPRAVTVILEAGYTASGIDTYGGVILPRLARRVRVCAYDRAGDGLSDPRPASARRLTGATQARELYALLRAIHARPPFVLVGHSYGGMINREFAALYRVQVAGMVLIDASSEPEIPVYDRLHAGPWIDGTVRPAPNQRIDIHATVRQLERSANLGAMPLVVITAGILQDRWLRTTPQLEARAQTRLASLSTDSVHVVDRGIGHFIPELDPQIVITATLAIVAAATRHRPLGACSEIFRTIGTADCLRPGQLGHQRT